MLLVTLNTIAEKIVERHKGSVTFIKYLNQSLTEPTYILTWKKSVRDKVFEIQTSINGTEVDLLPDENLVISHYTEKITDKINSLFKKRPDANKQADK